MGKILSMSTSPNSQDQKSRLVGTAITKCHPDATELWNVYCLCMLPVRSVGEISRAAQRIRSGAVTDLPDDFDALQDTWMAMLACELRDKHPRAVLIQLIDPYDYYFECSLASDPEPVPCPKLVPTNRTCYTINLEVLGLVDRDSNARGAGS